MLSSIAVLLCGCRSDMQDQPRYRPFAESRFFPDGRSARPLPEGTVARGRLRTDRVLYTGKKQLPVVAKSTVSTARPTSQPEKPAATAASFDPSFVTEFPFPITRPIMERGKQRFETFCTPCHGYLGNGRGMIVQRGLQPPPSYHTERLRDAPVGHFFDVITNGYGAMYSYASRVRTADRWAIIAYIRALQMSQGAAPTDAPPQELSRLRALPQQAPAGETRPGEIQPSRPATDQRTTKPGGAR